MLSNNETNSNIVEIQQLQQNNTTLSSEDLLKHMQSLEKRIKSLEVILGLFIGTLAAAITVGAGFAIAAAPIIAGSIVGGILATAALAALGVTAYKYRAEIKAGFKYAAEKTVDGAKYTAGKVRDGAVYAKDSVKEGYEHSVDSLKRGTHLVNKRAKEKVSNVLTATADKLYRAAGNENYSDRIDNELIPDSRQKKKVQGIKEDFRAIFANGEDNSTLIKSILSGISSKIAEKIAGETYLDFRDYLPNQEVDRWKEQKRFVDNLDASSLHNLITKRMLDKSKYFRDSIFSEHYDEIKEVIKECKENHLYSSVSNMFNKAEKRANRPSFKSLTRSISSSLSSLRRKDSTQSTRSLSESNSLNSIGTESTATVSDSDSQNFATVRRSNSSSSLTPKLTPVAPPELPRSASLTNLNRQSSFSEDVSSDPIVEQNLDSLSNRTLTHSNSIDSGVGSAPSTPERQIPSLNDLNQSRLRRTGLRNKLMEQQPPAPRLTESGSPQNGVERKM